MTSTPPIFRIPDLRRAVRGVRQAGEEIERVEIERDGRIVVYIQPRASQPEQAA